MRRQSNIAVARVPRPWPSTERNKRSPGKASEPPARLQPGGAPGRRRQHAFSRSNHAGARLALTRSRPGRGNEWRGRGKRVGRTPARAVPQWRFQLGDSVSCDTLDALRAPGHKAVQTMSIQDRGFMPLHLRATRDRRGCILGCVSLHRVEGCREFGSQATPVPAAPFRRGMPRSPSRPRTLKPARWNEMPVESAKLGWDGMSSTGPAEIQDHRLPDLSSTPRPLDPDLLAVAAKGRSHRWFQR